MSKTKKTTKSKREESESERNLFYLRLFHEQTKERLGLERQFEEVTGKPFPSNRGAWRRIAAEYLLHVPEAGPFNEDALRDEIMGRARRDKKLRHRPTMRESCDELADRLFAVRQTAEIAIHAASEATHPEVSTVKLDDDGREIDGTRRVLVDPAANQRKAHEAAVAFRHALDNAVAGIGLVDALTCKIGGREVQDWQSALKAELRKLGGAHTTWGRRLFDKGEAALRGQLTAIQECSDQLRSTHIPPQLGTAKPEAATVGAADARTVSDKPDKRGYVASPVDPTAYRPASEILSEAPETATMKQLVAIIEDRDNLVRWTRPAAKTGAPMMNRRSVHAGDWAQFEKRRAGTDSEGFPSQSGAEIEQRKAAIRQGKHTRK